MLFNNSIHLDISSQCYLLQSHNLYYFDPISFALFINFSHMPLMPSMAILMNYILRPYSLMLSHILYSIYLTHIIESLNIFRNYLMLHHTVISCRILMPYCELFLILHRCLYHIIIIESGDIDYKLIKLYRSHLYHHISYLNNIRLMNSLNFVIHIVIDIDRVLN